MDDLVGTGDPTRLKALAHPLRGAIVSTLASDGRASVTSLAGQLGESTGSVSYHLRQLAAAGVVEEFAPVQPGEEHHQPGRVQRWWRLTDAHAQPQAAKPAGPKAWRRAAVNARIEVSLSPARARALGAELAAVVHRYATLPAEEDAARVNVRYALRPAEPKGSGKSKRSNDKSTKQSKRKKAKKASAA